MSDQHVTTVWLNIRALESALSTQSKQCAITALGPTVDFKQPTNQPTNQPTKTHKPTNQPTNQPKHTSQHYDVPLVWEKKTNLSKSTRRGENHNNNINNNNNNNDNNNNNNNDNNNSSSSSNNNRCCVFPVAPVCRSLFRSTADLQRLSTHRLWP